MNSKKKCFVIMPISTTESCTEGEWTGIFEHMIKPAVTGSRLGFDCEQAKPRTGAFIKDILEGLNRADVVIADLTDKNPNVFYELGIRHTLKNRTILITQDIKHVPSDLRSYWVVAYKKDLTGANEFKKRIREILREMQKNPEKPDSPVADFLQLKNIDILAYEKSANRKKLSALISEMSHNISIADTVIDIVMENKQAMESGKPGSHCTKRFSNNCLDLLLSTSYIMFPEEWQSRMRTLSTTIVMLNNWLNAWTDEGFIKQVEEKFEEILPEVKAIWGEFMEDLVQFMIDYINDNYIEPKEPVICLSKQEHQNYLKLIK